MKKGITKTSLMFQIPWLFPKEWLPLLCPFITDAVPVFSIPSLLYCPFWSPVMYSASSHPGFGMHLHLSNSCLPDPATGPRSGPPFIYSGYVPAHFSCLLLKWSNQLSPQGNPATSDRARHSKACSSQLTWTLNTRFSFLCPGPSCYLCRPCTPKTLPVPCLSVCIIRSHRGATKTYFWQTLTSFMLSPKSNF